MSWGIKWSQEDIDYLIDKWGVISIHSIAKNLNRTVTAVNSKAYKLGLESYSNSTECISFRKFIDALGYGDSYSYLRNRLSKLDFPIKHKKIKKSSITVVYIDEFWEWAENHKNYINFANFEKGLLGIEPEWVNDKRIADKKNPSKIKHNREWTKAEENRMIEMCKSNRYTYKDISKELNRTENAVKRRLQHLKVPYRPIYLDCHKKWSEEENRRLIELYKDGYDSNYIARVLNKSQLSISDRIKKLKDA